MEFPHPLLVCEIGGTNIRMAYCDKPNAELGLLAPRRIAGFPDFITFMEGALCEIGERPRSLIVCGAGPVMGRHIRLTNAAWTIDGPQTAYRFGLSQGLLLNDFEAQALSIPIHRPEWLRAIGTALPRDAGPRVILGPGTGLGVAALLRDGAKHLPLASEAAHIEFAATNDEEHEIWSLVERAHGRITAETLVSGPGLARLHRARAQVHGFTQAVPDGPAVVAAGTADPSGHAGDSIRHFWRLVARLSGDLALTFLARGGITLSGGVLPHMVEFLEADHFRAEFENKAPMTDLVRGISTQMIEMKDAVLFGMAAIAARPQDYLIDYAARAWR